MMTTITDCTTKKIQINPVRRAIKVCGGDGGAKLQAKNNNNNVLNKYTFRCR